MKGFLRVTHYFSSSFYHNLRLLVRSSDLLHPFFILRIALKVVYMDYRTESFENHSNKIKKKGAKEGNIKPQLNEQFFMTSFLARVESEPVSLSSFSLSSIFARVNQQQVSLTISYCPIDQRYSWNGNNENNGMERSGLE